MPIIAAIGAMIGTIYGGLTIILAPLINIFLQILSMILNAVYKYLDFLFSSFPARKERSIASLIIFLFILLCTLVWIFGGV